MSQNGTPSDAGVTREPPLPAPTILEGSGEYPVLLSIPHSGRDYPDWLVSRSVGGRDALASLSDPHVDAIAQPLIEEGFAAVIATAPRAAIDPNRRPDELDPLIVDCAPPPPGSKAFHGIGLIPSRGRGRKPLWKERLGPAVVRSRLESGWEPYHAAISSSLATIKKRHGKAVLLDLHSMPPPRRGLPKLVLSDRKGESATASLVERMSRAASDAGWDVGINHPYLGGAIAQMHGRPAEQVEVVQIEFDRAAYLDSQLKVPGAGLSRVRQLLRAMVEAAMAEA